MIHNVRWRDDYERGEWFECPQCEYNREREEALAERQDEEDDEDEESGDEADE
jgi:hypothetical protein